MTLLTGGKGGETEESLLAVSGGEGNVFDEGSLACGRMRRF